MTRSIVFTTISLLLFWYPAGAQERDQKVQETRAAFKALEKKLENLQKPAPVSPRSIPAPLPSLMELSRRLKSLLSSSESLELDLSPSILMELARVHHALSDPAMAVRFAQRAGAHPRGTLFHQVQAGEFIIGEALRYGDFVLADKTAQALLKKAPDHGRAERWQTWAKEAQDRLKQQQQVLRSVQGMLIEASPDMMRQARYRGLRFAASFPMAPSSAKFLEQSWEAFDSGATPQQKAPVAERLALYHLDASPWQEASLIVTEVFATQGEYEKAVFHGRRLLELGRGLPATERRKVRSLLETLVARLKRIQARPLEVRPRTKRRRLAHFLALAGRREDPQSLLQMGEELCEDYPEMEEQAQVLWIMSRQTDEKEVARRMEILERLLTGFPQCRWAMSALEDVARFKESEEGAEACESWLKSLTPRFEDTPHAVRIVRMRARLLDGLDRWEDARALLIPLLPRSAGREADEIKAEIAALEKKIKS